MRCGMDKIFSARVDEEIIQQITRMATQLKVSKKKIVEEAIRSYVKKIEEKNQTNILHETFGTWQREETVEETVKKSRKTFSDSMKRHHS